MTQAELLDEMVRLAGVKRGEAQHHLVALAAAVRGELARGGGVDIPGIGKLTVADRAARQGRNPRTGEPIEVPASRAVKLRPAKALRDAVAPAPEAEPDRRRA